MCPWKRKLICQYKLQTSNFLGSKLVGVPNCFSKFYNSVISIKTFQCYSCTPHIDVATYGPSTKEDWIQNWITSQSTTSMTSYDRSCSLKMAALAIFSSMLYNADAIFFFAGCALAPHQYPRSTFSDCQSTAWGPNDHH